ncbi:MAG TPA: CRTAC1 family protein [Gemmatimonadales bacterium]|nr:CRTAC1 family protein [Gemmatimonadales bacterium]
MPGAYARVRKSAAGPNRPIPGLEWFQARYDREVERARTSPAFHDFTFTDRSARSGITFDNPFVDDAGIEHKRDHYDHGTGVSAADVDGDGRIDLYFVSQLGSSPLYRNLGDGRFEDMTAAAGLVMENAIAVAASFADIDNDGDPDLFLTTVRHGNRLFENVGRGHFRDITEAAGVGYVGHSSGAVFFDYDRDGRVDLFVSNVGRYTTDQKGWGGYYVGLNDAFSGHLFPDRAESSILYRNLGGNRFRDVSKGTGLVDWSWTGDATPLDANGDGWTDLYVLSMQGANHLWLNDGGKRFHDATSQFFPATPWGAMGVKVFDYNGDGRLDLFVTDMHSDMHTNLMPMDMAGEERKSDSASMKGKFFPEGKGGLVFGNGLFANRGGTFEEVSDAAGVESYWPWGPSVDDLNADGWDDIFIASSMNFPYRYQPNALLLNEAGRRFFPAEFLLGVEPRPAGMTTQVWFTLDCKGSDSNHIHCLGCARPGTHEATCGPIDNNGHRQVIGTLGSRSAVILDLDGDGDLDIVTQEFGSEPRVLVSDLAARRSIHWLEVTLTGTKSNREGLGSLVTVVLPDGRRLVKTMDGRSGYLAQSALPLYFGLGEAAQAERIEIEWPSGAHQTVSGPLLSGRRVVATEP